MPAPRSFGACLAEHLQRRGWSQRQFARLVEETQSLLTRVINGQRRPPLERVGRWIAALELDPAEAAECVRLALLAHDADGLLEHLRAATASTRAAERNLDYRR